MADLPYIPSSAPLDADTIADREANFQALVDDLALKFTDAKVKFDDTATYPGSGFDIDTWLDAVPTPTLLLATVDAIAPSPSFDANTEAPNVTDPVFVTPEAVSAIAEAAYDSEYLDAIEAEIRVITANVIDDVIPAAEYDAYFRAEYAKRARDARDAVDTVLDKQGKRGFPAVTMTASRQVAHTIGMWQDATYKMQDDSSAGRIELAQKVFFSAVKSGVDVEQIRSRAIMDYAKFYSRVNSTLATYYKEFTDEALAAVKLLLDNDIAGLQQNASNVDIVSRDNKEEVALPEEVFRRALGRVEEEFKVDTELLERRRAATLKICDTYASWLSGAYGSSQSLNVAKYDATS